jgi:hypothetical protein
VTRSLLIAAAAIEAPTGLALIASPSALVSLLLGTSLDTPGGQVIARVAGASLLALATACWRARDDGPARAVVTAMLVYNSAVAAILAYAGLVMGLAGVGLWPVVGLHAALAVWCIARLSPREPVERRYEDDRSVRRKQ